MGHIRHVNPPQVGGSEEMLKLVCSSNAWINRINLAFNLASPMPTPSIVFWWTDAIHRRSQYSLSNSS